MERRLQVASFFSGIGGFDLGFEMAGMTRSPKDFVMTEKLGRLIQEAAQMLSVRRMTPSEYEKLQGFPADWTLVDSES